MRLFHVFCGSRACFSGCVAEITELDIACAVADIVHVRDQTTMKYASMCFVINLHVALLYSKNLIVVPCNLMKLFLPRERVAATYRRRSTT